MRDCTQLTQEERYQIGMRIHLLSATGELNPHQITEHPLPDYATQQIVSCGTLHAWTFIFRNDAPSTSRPSAVNPRGCGVVAAP